MAFGPRWSLGYANTAMSLTDAPDAQAQLARLRRRTLAKHDVPLLAPSTSDPATRASASGATCSRGIATSFPSRAKRSTAFARRGHPHGRQPEALPARRSSCVRGGRGRAARSCSDAQTGAPCIGQFWDGEGAHVDFTHPAGIALVAGGSAAAGARLRHRRRLERQQRIRDLGRLRRSRTASAAPIPIDRSRPLQRAADDARDVRGAGARIGPTSASTP